MMNLVRIPLLALVMPLVAQAQEAQEIVVKTRVTRIDGRFVEIDVGIQAGLREGDTLQLKPEALGPRVAILRSVGETTARAEVVGSIAGISVDTLGELKIPAARQAEEVTPAPEWAVDLEGWDDSQPLLTPIAAIKPEERPTRFSGRTWFGYESWSTELADYGSARAGLSLDVENPFGRGGQFESELRFVQQTADGQTFGGSLDEAIRVERYSYTIGGTRQDPDRIQVGRFLHHLFPELGVLDGAEYTHRMPSGARVGAALGYLPEWTAERRTGEDLSLAVFSKVPLDADQALQAGAALQKTWHRGESDRDLGVFSIEWFPEGPWSVRASAMVDVYGSEDQFKDGVELTQGRVTAGWSEDGSGTSVSLTRIAWPELLRTEFPEQLQEVLTEGQVDRVDLYGWTRVEDWRLSASLDSWSDQEGSGGGAELRAALQDRWIPDGEVGASLRDRRGRFLEGMTARAFAAWWGGRGTFRADLEFSDVDTTAGSAIGDQRLRLSWDTRLGDDWQLSLRGTQQSGDFDSTLLSFVITRYF